MKRCIFFGDKPSRKKGCDKNEYDKQIQKKKIVVIFKFRISCLNPHNDSKLALKVTFKKGITEPVFRAENDYSVTIIGVDTHEIIKEQSTNLFGRYFTVIGKEEKVEIRINDKSETLYIGIPEKIK